LFCFVFSLIPYSNKVHPILDEYPLEFVCISYISYISIEKLSTKWERVECQGLHGQRGNRIWTGSKRTNGRIDNWQLTWRKNKWILLEKVKIFVYILGTKFSDHKTIRDKQLKHMMIDNFINITIITSIINYYDLRMSWIG